MMRRLYAWAGCTPKPAAPQRQRRPDMLEVGPRAGMSEAASNPEVEGPARRFRVAFSFAGEKREFVSEMAAIIAERFGEEAVLYDRFHEAEFARDDLGLHLPNLYNKQSELVVV